MMTNLFNNIKNKFTNREYKATTKEDCVTSYTGKPISNNIIPGTRNSTIQSLYSYNKEHEELCKTKFEVEINAEDLELLSNILFSSTVNIRNILVLCATDIIKTNVFLDKLLDSNYNLDEYITLFLQPMNRIVKEKRKLGDSKEADKVAILISSLKFLARIYRKDASCIEEKFYKSFSKDVSFDLMQELSNTLASHVRQVQERILMVLTDI